MPSIICKNCDHHFKGNFCPHCGQSAKVEAIGIKYFLHDIPHSIFHIDKGFFYTFKELLFRPGKTLREYLEGKRVKHFRPFAYVILMATIYILLHILIRKATVFIGHQLGISITYKEEFHFFENYTSIFFFLMIPFNSLATWIALRKEKYNYWEHFLINTYLTAQLTILFLLTEVYRSIKVLVLQVPTTFTFIWFITGFMFYIVFVFKNLINPKTHRLAYSAKFFLLAFLLVLVYLTGMSFAGLMSPWWGGK